MEFQCLYVFCNTHPAHLAEHPRSSRALFGASPDVCFALQRQKQKRNVDYFRFDLQITPWSLPSIMVWVHSTVSTLLLKHCCQHKENTVFMSLSLHCSTAKGMKYKLQAKPLLQIGNKKMSSWLSAGICHQRTLPPISCPYPPQIHLPWRFFLLPPCCTDTKHWVT